MAFTNGNSARPFADVVSARKEELGLSFRELARVTQELDDDGRGLSSAYLVQLFNGNEDPVPRAIRLIASALGLEPEDIIEYWLQQMRDSLDERVVGVECAVANFRALGGADARKRVSLEGSSRAPGRRRQTVSR